MPQKWEYKFVLRTRGVGGFGHTNVGDWEVFEDGKSLGKIDTSVVSQRLGENGWELVSVSPRSSQALCGSESTAGITSEELWVFKRPK